MAKDRRNSLIALIIITICLLGVTLILFASLKLVYVLFFAIEVVAFISALEQYSEELTGKG